MTAFFENIFSTIFGDNVVLATILIAIIPIIELKGAIPFSMSSEIWKSSALSKWSAFGCGLLGSSLIVPILALIYIPLINWLKRTKLFRSLGNRLDSKVNKKKEGIEEKSNGKKSSKLIKILAVFLFVAFPLPFTGVWTGTCLAVALGLGFWLSTITVILGNVVAGLIITLLSSVIPSIIFFYIFLGLILLFALVMLFRRLIKNKQEKVQNDNMLGSAGQETLAEKK